MWLPKDERKLLTRYYKLIGDIEKNQSFDKWGDPAKPGSSVQSDDGPVDSCKVKAALDKRSSVGNANKALAAKGLIAISPHQNDSTTDFVSLTAKGYDLGRRYDNWRDWFGLWFENYRKGLVWALVTILGASGFTFLLNKVFLASPGTRTVQPASVQHPATTSGSQ